MCSFPYSDSCSPLMQITPYLIQKYYFGNCVCMHAACSQLICCNNPPIMWPITHFQSHFQSGNHANCQWELNTSANSHIHTFVHVTCLWVQCYTLHWNNQIILASNEPLDALRTIYLIASDSILWLKRYLMGFLIILQINTMFCSSWFYLCFVRYNIHSINAISIDSESRPCSLYNIPCGFELLACGSFKIWYNMLLR